MLKVLFWIYVASAVIVFLYVFLFALLATIHFAKECKTKGMVRKESSTNPAKKIISLLQSVLMIGLPAVNTFIAIIWLCNTERVIKAWKEKTIEMYCYPNELSKIGD